MLSLHLHLVRKPTEQESNFRALRSKYISNDSAKSALPEALGICFFIVNNPEIRTACWSQKKICTYFNGFPRSFHPNFIFPNLKKGNYFLFREHFV